MERPSKMKVAGLRASLERRGIDSSGLKKVLQERLTAALEEEQAGSEPVAAESSSVFIPMDEEPAAAAVPVEPVVPALVEPAPVDMSMDPAALARHNSLTTTAPVVPAATVSPAAANNAYSNEAKQERGMLHKPLRKPDQLGR